MDQGARGVGVQRGWASLLLAAEMSTFIVPHSSPMLHAPILAMSRHRAARHTLSLQQQRRRSKSSDGSFTAPHSILPPAARAHCSQLTERLLLPRGRLSDRRA
ncbi:unnamed protein product [Cercospora beticola]|nr:unnamed protein product [Cercospora beticola]